MNKKLLAELKKMEDWEFYLLEQHMSVARMVRDTISKNGLHPNEMALHLDILPVQMKSVINGSHPFDLRFVSKLQAYQQKIAANNAKLKIEAESMGFSQYKDQYPLFIDRINKLLDKLENKS
jgi:hypothetical protein